MWHKVAKISDLEDGKAQLVEIAGQSIALFKVAGEFYALQNQCPHRGGPLAEGYLDGTTVTCPWHAWEFDVKSGECGTMPGTKQPSFKTKVENGEVFIEVS